MSASPTGKIASARLRSALAMTRLLRMLYLNYMSKKSGFTYIELLIYMSVFAVISFIFASILTTFTRLHTQQLAETELNNQLNFAIQTIQKLVASPETATITVNNGGSPQDQDVNPGSVLVLRRKNSSEDPTKIYVSNNAVVIKKGGQAEAPITTNKVSVSTLIFNKKTNAPTFNSVKITLALQYAGVVGNISRQILATVGRASAATFDADVYPVSDNISNIGLSSNRWKNGFFSGLLQADGGVRVSTVAVKPSCSTASDRGLIWVTPGASGDKDKVEVCAKDSTDTFAWRLLY